MFVEVFTECNDATSLDLTHGAPTIYQTSIWLVERVNKKLIGNPQSIERLRAIAPMYSTIPAT